MKTQRVNSEQGAILLIVLWVIIVLSVLAFGFASNVQMGARSVRNTKDGTAGYFLAKAAVNESIFEWMSLIPQGGTDAAAAARRDGFKQQRVSGEPITFKLATGVAECRIENEAGKFDLNAGSPVVFRNLLMRQFELSDTAADALVARWTERLKITPDPSGVLHGGPLNAVEDLLGLDGMKPEYVYGYWGRSRDGAPIYRGGLRELATVYSGSPRINLNAAPVELLRALPGVDAAEAEALVRARRNHFFESVDDCQQRTPLQFNTEARNVVGVEDSSVLTLVATGRPENSGGYERTVRAIVAFGSNDPLGYRIVYWKDEEI